MVTSRLSPLPESSGDSQSLCGLPGDVGDEVEILVQVQDRVPGAFGHSGDQQVGYAGGSVLTVIGELHLDLDGALLHCRSEVFDRHQPQRWLTMDRVSRAAP